MARRKLQSAWRSPPPQNRMKQSPELLPIGTLWTIATNMWIVLLLHSIWKSRLQHSQTTASFSLRSCCTHSRSHFWNMNMQSRWAENEVKIQTSCLWMETFAGYWQRPRNGKWVPALLAVSEALNGSGTEEIESWLLGSQKKTTKGEDRL